MIAKDNSLNHLFPDLFESFGNIFRPESTMKELEEIEKELLEDEFYMSLETQNVRAIYKYDFVTKRLQLIINGLKK